MHNAMLKTEYHSGMSIYLAEDRETAYKEKFGLYQKENHKGLTAEELLLTHNDSISIVTLKGEISSILDLNNSVSLKDFFNIIKTILLPDSFIRRANKLNINPLYQVKTLKELLKNLLYPNWRAFPMYYDIPANSQIFGQIARAAGIEGILYPSKTTNKKCLAIFPENLAQSSSFIDMEDDAPEGVKYVRLDSKTYQHCV
jgi:hypothetical protein